MSYLKIKVCVRAYARARVCVCVYNTVKRTNINKALSFSYSSFQGLHCKMNKL